MKVVIDDVILSIIQKTPFTTSRRDLGRTAREGVGVRDPSRTVLSAQGIRGTTEEL